MNIVPLTLWREARGEGADGMIAVNHVILNRARAGKHWPVDPEEVCLQPYQFSCWNTDDSQRKLYPKDGDALYAEALNIHSQPLGADPTGGATFYRNVKVAGPFPSGYRVTAVIGNHTFAVEG